MNLTYILHQSKFYKQALEQAFTRLRFVNLIKQFKEAGIHAAVSTEGPVILMCTVNVAYPLSTPPALFAMHVTDATCSPFVMALDELAHSKSTGYYMIMWYVSANCMEEMKERGFNVDNFSQDLEDWRTSKD